MCNTSSHPLHETHPNGWHHQNICWPAACFIIHISLQAFQFDNACFYCPCRFSSVSAFTSTQISYVCTYMTWDLLYRKWNLLWEAGICACDTQRERRQQLVLMFLILNGYRIECFSHVSIEPLWSFNQCKVGLQTARLDWQLYWDQIHHSCWPHLFNASLIAIKLTELQKIQTHTAFITQITWWSVIAQELLTCVSFMMSLIEVFRK